VLGKSLFEFVTGSGNQSVFEAIVDKLRKNGRPFSFPIRCDAPDTRRYLDIRLHPALNGSIIFESHVLKEEKRAPMEILNPDRPKSKEQVVICGWCKKLRLPQENWVEIEDAVNAGLLDTSGLLPDVSHGMCVACYDKTMQDLDNQ
jgi:hypothetical protein